MVSFLRRARGRSDVCNGDDAALPRCHLQIVLDVAVFKLSMPGVQPARVSLRFHACHHRITIIVVSSRLASSIPSIVITIVVIIIIIIRRP